MHIDNATEIRSPAVIRSTLETGGTLWRIPCPGEARYQLRNWLGTLVGIVPYWVLRGATEKETAAQGRGE